MSFLNSIIFEKEFKKQLNSDELTSLRSLTIQASQLKKDKSIVNNMKFIHLIAESSVTNQLEDLTLICMNMDDESLENIQLSGLNFLNLRKSDLSWNFKLAFGGFMKIFEIKMPQLEYLNI